MKNKEGRNEVQEQNVPMLLAQGVLNPSSVTPPNQASSISQLHGVNSLRAQLLARSAFGPTLGYMPQQYGIIST